MGTNTGYFFTAPRVENYSQLRGEYHRIYRPFTSSRVCKHPNTSSKRHNDGGKGFHLPVISTYQKKSPRGTHLTTVQRVPLYYISKGVTREIAYKFF